MSEERTKLNQVTGYDDRFKCQSCQGRNVVTAIDVIENITMEAETLCSKCGDKNYWIHGFYAKS